MGTKELENRGARKAAENKGIVADGLGQHYPRQNPRPGGGEQVPLSSSRLGQPLSIKQAATLIGVSPWTIRQVLLPQGLPHFRCARTGRLIFYSEVITAWLMKHMQGGRPK